MKRIVSQHFKFTVIWINDQTEESLMIEKRVEYEREGKTELYEIILHLRQSKCWWLLSGKIHHFSSPYFTLDKWTVSSFFLINFLFLTRQCRKENVIHRYHVNWFIFSALRLRPDYGLLFNKDRKKTDCGIILMQFVCKHSKKRKKCGGGLSFCALVSYWIFIFVRYKFSLELKFKSAIYLFYIWIEICSSLHICVLLRFNAIPKRHERKIEKLSLDQNEAHNGHKHNHAKRKKMVIWL